MKSRLWLNILLACAALGLFYLLQSEQAPEMQGPRLTTLAPSAIDRIRLLRAGEEEVLLRRQANGWVMTRPLSLPANTVRIESLLKLLVQPHHGRFPLAELDLEAIGLEAPRVAVEFNDLRIEFGHTDPLSQRRYARIGDHVYLIGDQTFHSVVARVSGFISLRLLSAGEDLVSIELPGISLSREQAGWRLESEQAARSGDDPQRLAQTWQSASALAVEPEGAVGQDGHEMITLGLRGGESLRLAIIRREPDLVLWRQDLGLLYRFTEHQARQMLELSPERD